jgi:hypothetical protein
MEKDNTAHTASGGVTPLFQHPDGPRIDFDDWALVITDDEDQSASMPIGPLGLIELGNTLIALGRALGGGL